MKKCPYCAEDIQDAAIVCRYCGKELQIDTLGDIAQVDLSKLTYRQRFAVTEYGYLLSPEDAEIVGKMLGSIVQSKDVLVYCKEHGKKVSTEPIVMKLNEPTKKMNQQGIFIPAFKIGLVLAIANTFINAIGIWNLNPSVSYLNSLGATGESALLVFRLSRLIGAAIPNLILWFIVALVLMFIVRQVKKA